MRIQICNSTWTYDSYGTSVKSWPISQGQNESDENFADYLFSVAQKHYSNDYSETWCEDFDQK